MIRQDKRRTKRDAFWMVIAAVLLAANIAIIFARQTDPDLPGTGVDLPEYVKTDYIIRNS